MFIVMAGLPGTGKSTIAQRLKAALGAIVLNKDVVRDALFPPPVCDFSRGQDDLCMAAIYGAASHILGSRPSHPVIVDGRTFSTSQQVEHAASLARRLKQKLLMIECVCDEHIARERIERDYAEQSHPAGNRTYELYTALKATADPILIPRLVIDTGRLSLEESVERCLEYLGIA